MEHFNLLWAFLSPLESNTSPHKSLSELITAKLEAPQLSIRAAKKWGILDLSTSFHYDQLKELGELFIKGVISLKDFLSYCASTTKVCDATYVKREGKRVYGAKINKERSAIEQTNKELKSYLGIEGNHFKKKESNYGYIFLLSLIYNLVQYQRLYIDGMSFKDVLELLSFYLLWKTPPKFVFSVVEPLKCMLDKIESGRLNKINLGLMEPMGVPESVRA